MYKVTFLSIFHLSNSPLTETQIQRYLSHVGTQAFHVNSFSKEKECREIALKSTGDLPVKVKHTSTFYHWDGWLFGVCIWVGSLISKHTTQVYEHLVAFKFPALLPNDSVFALFFLWKGNQKGIFWLHFSHWWVCQWQKHIKTVHMNKSFIWYVNTVN